MQNKDAEKRWSEYVKRELEVLVPLLDDLGFKLEEHQPHIIGERFITSASTMGGGRKLILIGTQSANGRKVVIKATRERSGKRELKKERESRDILRDINFAYDSFLSPKEILYTDKRGFSICVNEFVEQESTFLERPMKDQFSIALNAFKIQEGAHSTTYKHEKLIRRTFERFDSKKYVNNFELFRSNVAELSKILSEGLELLKAGSETIDQYSGFLTHVDFVPHNFRVRDGKIYLLDHSSIRFGNKYEGWARFLNFMALYNPELEKALTDYVHNNRTPEEHLSLKLMRVYRLGDLIYYYSRTLREVTGDLHKLNKARISFWAKVLKAVLQDDYISKKNIDDYKKIRDSLRSEEEKKRQIGLH